MAACADRFAGRQGGRRHLRDFAARTRDRGAGARRTRARRAGTRRCRGRARRLGREDQARLAAGGRIEEGAAGEGPVVAIPRSRHRAGRRDFHQVSGDGGGRHRHVDRRAQVLDLEQSRARGGGCRDLERKNRRREPRQRREPARCRRPLRAAAEQGQGQQCLDGDRPVHPAVRQDLLARRRAPHAGAAQS